MSLADFLIERCVEALESESCTYERRSDGGLLCECETPSEPVVRVMDQVGLIRWCEARPGIGDMLLRALGDAYATHDDFQPEWHRIRLGA